MNRSRFVLLVAVLLCPLLAQMASAQNISIVSGNGQAICVGCGTTNLVIFQSLVVKVTDSAGNPQAGVTVNWSITPVGASLLGTSSVTDSNGMAFNSLFVSGGGLPTNAFSNFTQYTVTASTGTSSVNFYETQFIPVSGTPNPIVYQAFGVNIPTSGTLTGQAGTTSSTQYQVRLTDRFGNPVPNVAMSLVNQQPADQGATVACASTPAGAGANVALTDATGLATCTPVFLSPGQGTFFAALAAQFPGGDTTQTPNALYASFPLGLSVTPAGSPGSVKIISGNNQSGTAGQAIANPLVAEVDSTSGAVLQGIPVTWTVSPNNAANLSNTTSTSDSTGRVSTNVTLTSTASGTVTVTAALTSDPTKKASFTITAGQPVTITGFTIFSGNNQSASIGGAFGSPLVVQVTTSAGTAQGIPVQFSSSGPVTLSATSATTDANGRAQVTATAGTVSGAASVTASVSGTTGVGSQTFSLTVLPPAPPISASSFVNAADAQPNAFSPCSLAAIVGNQGTLGVSGMLSLFPGLPLPGKTTAVITVGGNSAPILASGTNANGRGQITFQIPCNVTPGASVPVSFGIGSGATTPVNLNIQAASPGIFQTQNSDGALRAVLVRPDGSFVSLENPARRGENVVAYVTGLGVTNPPLTTTSASTGTVVPPALPPPSSDPNGQTTPLNVAGTVIVGLHAGGAPLNYARLSEDLPGVYVVSFQIPPDMVTGNDVAFSIGIIPQGGSTTYYSATSKIPIQ